jgi:uncharacterized protein YdaL
MFANRTRSVVAVVVLVAALASCKSPSSGTAQPGPSTTLGTASPSADPGGTLVLYDTTGPYGFLGELYAIQAANLASHFAGWTTEPVSRYRAGDAAHRLLTIYLGSTYDEPIPAAFLADVAAGARVLWLGDNIWQLAAKFPKVLEQAGFTTTTIDNATVTEVRYRGASLTRNSAAGGVVKVTVTDPTKATIIADAVHADGQVVPWGARGANLAYIGEIPFTYLSSNDRYLALCDVLFDLLAPNTPERHRALVRIEDVGPHSDPAQLRAIADYLYGRKVPFSVATFVEYDDPKGVYSGGTPVHRRLSQAPALVQALRYMAAHGGTLLMHGYTHGYAAAANPYGVSAEDFEFWRAHVDPQNMVVLDGPVPEDSASWALGRFDAARKEWAAAGLTAPDIWEFPHYTASAVDYQAISPRVKARYERAIYFSGLLNGGTVDTTHSASQFFPYAVKDVYGAPVIPETLGNIASQKFNQHGVRLPADLVAAAKQQLVVRDGVASFFYHPFLGLQYLPELVDGIQALGYTFVAPLTLGSPIPSS